MPICPILCQRSRVLTVFVLKRRSQFISKIFTIYTKDNPSLHQRSRVLVSDSLCPHKNISSVNCWTTLLLTNLGSCHGMVHHYISVHWGEIVQRNKRQLLCVKWSRPSWWVVQNLEGEVWWHFGLSGTTWYPCALCVYMHVWFVSSSTLPWAHGQLCCFWCVGQKFQSDEQILVLYWSRFLYQYTSMTFKCHSHWTEISMFLENQNLMLLIRKWSSANSAYNGIKAVSYTHLTLPTSSYV